jgi:hypothetical protein
VVDDRPIVPLTNGFLLDRGQFARLKRLFSRLIQKTKDLSHSGFAVLESQEEGQLQEFLAEAQSGLQQQLMELKEMSSLQQSFTAAFSSIEVLMRTSDYQLHGLI